eukprot:Skav209425  [mRNA]  locus=scaffold805:57168:58748:- [translate_table: standard]
MRVYRDLVWYEALDPFGKYACSDPAAELRFSLSTCPSKGTLRYDCDFFATQESIRNCSSALAAQLRGHQRSTGHLLTSLTP